MIDGSFQETCGIFTGKNGELIANSSLKSIYRNRKLKPESMARPGSLLGCPVSTFLEASLGMLMFCGAKNLYLETVEWIITTSSLPEKWMFKQGDDVKNANMLERKVQYLILLAKKTERVELPFLLVFAPLNHHDSIMVRDVLNYCTMFFEQVSFCTSLLIDREFFRFPKKHTPNAQLNRCRYYLMRRSFKECLGISSRTELRLRGDRWPGSIWKFYGSRSCCNYSNMVVSEEIGNGVKR